MHPRSRPPPTASRCNSAATTSDTSPLPAYRSTGRCPLPAHGELHHHRGGRLAGRIRYRAGPQHPGGGAHTPVGPAWPPRRHPRKVRFIAHRPAQRHVGRCQAMRPAHPPEGCYRCVGTRPRKSPSERIPHRVVVPATTSPHVREMATAIGRRVLATTDPERDYSGKRAASSSASIARTAFGSASSRKASRRSTSPSSPMASAPRRSA
jgi:hypothetical protein